MTYPYTLDVPPPVEGQDAADYFLFELKQGYCDYYATAMVVLARASGLPARFVSGYSPGEYDAPGAQYIVREMHAHSWAEVYFPEIGWVEFEPTALLPEIERAEESALSPADQPGGETATGLFTRLRLWRISLWSLPAVVAFAMLLYAVFIDRWLILRRGPEAAIEALYRRFYRAARALAGAPTRAETSSEFLSKLSERIDSIPGPGFLAGIPAGIKTNATRLTDLYHASLFTRRRVSKPDAITAWRIWRRLQREIFLVRLMYGSWRPLS
jgi:transglutaminase-like putative cysteine protease